MYILFDIGGTKMRIARSGDEIAFDEPLRFETPAIFEEGIKEIKSAVTALAGGEKILGMVGGIAGTLDEANTTLVNSTHLPQWIGKPLKKQLEKIFETDILIENDSALAGLGEAHCGAGKDSEIVAYITVSTGVGGARIIKGVLDQSRFGFEPGHQIITAGGAHCLECDTVKAQHTSLKSLDDIISGTAVERRFGRKPYDIPQHDPMWNQLAYLLAVGLNNSTVHWSPDVVILGGSMIVGDPSIPMVHIERFFNNIVTIFPKKPLLRKASLKDSGGLYGARILLKQQYG